MAAGAEPNDLHPPTRTTWPERASASCMACRSTGRSSGGTKWSPTGRRKEPERDEETPKDAAQAVEFDLWRLAAFEAADCVVLDLGPLSEVAGEIDDFLADAGQQVGGLEEIRGFLAAARREAPETSRMACSSRSTHGAAVSSAAWPCRRTSCPSRGKRSCSWSLVPLAKNVPVR
jgi:hypothetical protein